MTHRSEPSALVRGCGPTGALAALALADAGWRVQLQDPLNAQRLLARRRAYALTHSSRSLLERLGLWQQLSSQLIPFEQLQLCDLGSGAPSTCFSATELGLPAVGWIANHGDLLQVLLEALKRQSAVALALGEAAQGAAAASDGTPWELIVAADGPQSPSRDAAGIACWRWSYGQECLTAQVDLRGASAHQAWELFRPEGPLALLPLGGSRFQLVWSASPERCRQLVQMGPDGLLDHMAAALPDRFQGDHVVAPAQSFAVGLALAQRLHRGRTVLVGESGHCSHPVGGQGLNLCWRDVAVLHRLAQRVSQGRLSSAALPRHYAARRWPDLLLTLAATDLLVRLFSNRAPLLLPLRHLGLTLLSRSKLLRRLSLGVMTHGPCGPWWR
ncbi:MAG: FAD-dependent monooxygenase [Cyanobacteriota bacterium]|nr:FAD-dependent monooxygenase [Cyanobacteriota bacterium]